MTAEAEDLYRCAEAKARWSESQRIAAWLRRWAQTPDPFTLGFCALSAADRSMLTWAADRIERGDHRLG